MNWLNAVQEVKRDHQFCMIHTPTGNKVTKRKTNFYIDTLESIENLETEGYSDKAICKILPTAKKVLKTDCVLMDAVTANMLCCIYDALSPDNQKKFAGFKIDFAVKTGWKLYEKCKV